MDNYKEVSEELSNELENHTQIPDDKQSLVEEIEAEAKEYRRCTWYKGCYYCKINGRWRLIRCVG